MAYAIVIARFAFFIKRAAHYEENLRATGFFETDLEWVGRLNAATDLHMDIAFQIASTNGTALKYDKTYFNLEVYQRSVDEKGKVSIKEIETIACNKEEEGHKPFGEIGA